MVGDGALACSTPHIIFERLSWRRSPYAPMSIDSVCAFGGAASPRSICPSSRSAASRLGICASVSPASSALHVRTSGGAPRATIAPCSRAASATRARLRGPCGMP